jgi:hypothetical protein
MLLVALTPVMATERFIVDATLKPLATSTDGRFTIDASARYAPAATSAGGRYTLTAVRVPDVGCDADADPLFANGFENP